MAVMPAFCSDANPDVIFECLGFDEPWNGWASPIVSWETVIDVLQEAEWMVKTEGAIILAASDPGVPEDEIVVLEPDDEARYHLRNLGWTLIEVATFDTKVLPFRRPERS